MSELMACILNVLMYFVHVRLLLSMLFEKKMSSSVKDPQDTNSVAKS